MNTFLTAVGCTCAIVAMFSTAAFLRVSDVAIAYEDRNVQLQQEIADLREAMARQDLVIYSLECEVRDLGGEDVSAR